MNIGLRGRNDCPLKIQFEEGQRAFYIGYTRNPYPLDTMKAREWERGYTSKYFQTPSMLKQKMD